MADTNTLVEELSGLTFCRLLTRQGPRIQVGRQRRCSRGSSRRARRWRGRRSPVEEKTAFDVILKEPAPIRSPSSRKSALRSPGSASPRQRPSWKALQDHQGRRHKEEAEEIKKKIEAAGAKVEIK